ncbi:hypothetical protein BD289DRAFT_208574 [Coniella lustricola]|uniref:Rhodopsin domain-containing protein n=1 Tax=Coniella lustricola TaxID=2025994 RepID=A0A2T3AC03_9PEZI|nr:hypothetical protein BD289DRAFT_208574 [Coniella lustricola]
MSEVGLMPVPAGETADFHGMSDLQRTILAVYITTSALATIGLVLRLYTGAILSRNLGLDAFFLIAAWAIYLASFIGMVEVMPCGFGKHLWSVTESGLQCYENMLLFLGVSYFWPPTLAKLSLIILYHRINPSRNYRLALYGIAFACTTYTLVFTIILSVPCNPLHDGTTTCLNNLALAQAILNITTDGVLIIMPVITLYGLQMPRKQKVTVGLILGLGSGAVIASCVRIAYVRAMQDNPDVLYTQGSAAVWSAVEINIGILCNCLAMLKPFVRHHLPWLRSLIGMRSGASGSAGPIHPPEIYGKRAGLGGNGSGGGDSNGASAARQHHLHHLHKERLGSGRKGSGPYELYSYGRDKGGFGDFWKPGGSGGPCGTTRAAHIEGACRSDSRTDSLNAAQEEAARQGGILVVTTLAMGRSSQGDGSSTEEILAGERSIDDDDAPVSIKAKDENV